MSALDISAAGGLGIRNGLPARWRSLGRVLPGLGLCAAVTVVATIAEAVERRVSGRPWLEALALAIVLGVAVRMAWRPPARFQSGIEFSAKTLLETAVVLLGASISLRSLVAVGPALLVGIMVVVALVLPASFLIGRLLGLPKRLALLVACGNSICGNSAIAAVAPVIGAGAEDIAASIAFTAVLGVAVVLGLPALCLALGMGGAGTGALAGLTVYAVPQVIAAAAPAGPIAVQVGTVVKLVRVLMLGPVVLLLSLRGPSLMRDASTRPLGGAIAPKPRAPHRLVPWFIVGFFALAALNSAGLIPAAASGPLAAVTSTLTILSMAALGLGVDIRVVARAGGRVTAAVILSLVVLGSVSLGLIRLLGIA